MSDGESIYRPDGSANLDAAAKRFENTQGKPETGDADDSGLSRRAFVLGAAAIGGAAIGNELGNLGRSAMESNALANAESKLDPAEIAAADKAAEQLSMIVEEYKESLKRQGLDEYSIDRKVKSYVLRVLDSFNKKELAPTIVPKSNSSIISSESQE